MPPSSCLAWRSPSSACWPCSAHYERIYWDFVAAGMPVPASTSPSVPLAELMRKAGFSEQEFAKLQEAQANSDGLVKTAQVVSTMGAIKESSSQIADIIGVIDGIAFQTNILALNAAVEAARAGEPGRTMALVVESIQKVAAIMSEITSASHEQSAGISEVNQAVTQMDNITQQNAALVEQAAAAAESLQEQAQALITAVAIFRLKGSPPATAALALR